MKSDETAEADEHRALRYDFGEGMLEIGLILTSLYFISKKKNVSGDGCAVRVWWASELRSRAY